MAYLGNPPAEAYTTTVKDSFNGDGSTVAFTMSQPSTTNNVRVVVENVIQDPTVAYTCSGTTLTFTSAPPTGTANIYVVHLGPAVQSIVPPAEISLATTYTSDLTVQGDLTVDTSTLYVDSANNRVGVGTASPAEPLHVVGTVRSSVSSTGDFNFYATSDGGGAYRIYPDDATTANPVWQHQSNSNESQSWVIGGVERMRVLSSGGITFNGDTAAANALNDYEEGTWTPTLGTTSTNFTSVSYTQQLGQYTKIGRSVTVSMLIQISTYSGGAGNVTIEGLPFTVSNTDGAMYSQWLTNDKMAVTVTSGYVFRGGYFYKNTGKMQLMQSQISGASPSSGVPVSGIGSNFYMYASGTYFTDS